MLPDADWLRLAFLVARREVLTRVRNRFFLVSTIALVALTVGYIFLQANVFSRSGTTVKVAFSGEAAVLAAPLVIASEPLGVKVKTSTVGAVGDGESQVRDGTVDALVYGSPTAPSVAVKDSLNVQVQAALTGIVRQEAFNRSLAARGVSPATVAAEVAAASLKLQTLDPGAEQRTARSITGVVVAILLYVMILIYGQVVAAGVVEEKSNRIVEILLATIRPRLLLLGKVLGIGLVGTIQLVIVGIAGLIAVSQTNVISLPNVGVSAVVGGLVWFILGYLFFGLLYAAGGSLVSRQEDLGSVMAPFSVLLVGTYLAFYWVLANPDLPAAIGLSMIPPFAPILMSARMATGDAAAWQVLVALVLTLLAIAGMNYLAARIYTNSVMRTGVRVSLREAWAPKR